MVLTQTKQWCGQAAHADANAIRFHCAGISRKKHAANPKGSLASGRVHGRHSAPPFVVVLSNYFCPTVRSRIIAIQKWRPRIATLGLIAVQSYPASVVIAEVNALVILCKCKNCALRGTTRIPRWTPLRHLSGSAPPPSSSPIWKPGLRPWRLLPLSRPRRHGVPTSDLAKYS